MPSLFTKIIKGEIPCHKVLEDEKFIAFLDIRPIKTGHTLVIPKQEVDYIFDLSNELLAEILLFSKKVAAGIKAAVPCKRVGMMVAGLEVPHCHVHLIPIDRVGDLNFALSKPAEPSELAKVAEKIIASF